MKKYLKNGMQINNIKCMQKTEGGYEIEKAFLYGAEPGADMRHAAGNFCPGC